MNEKNMLEQMYWQQGFSLPQIAKELSWSYAKTYKQFRIKYRIDTHKSIWNNLEIEEPKLRLCLNNKYSMIVRRVSGKHDPYNTYKGKVLLTEREFVELCNERKQQILRLWNQYVVSGKQLKFAVSIDRVDNNLDYTKDNLQFVTFGFNSWKDLINPITVQKHSEQIQYFGSPEEASRFYNCRPDDLREVLRGEKYNRQNATVTRITISELLKHHNCSDLQEYYSKHLV
jgi:hypothetical protein